MLFEWDERKNRKNLRKHGISFELASEVFHDPFLKTRLDDDSDGEERYQALGRLENSWILLVIHTWRNEADELVVRIISARKATANERRTYEEAESY